MTQSASDPSGFAAEVRQWLAANYPTELKGADARTDPEAVWGGRRFVGSDDPQILWLRRMAERGWTAPTWPRAYGGGGLSADEAACWRRSWPAAAIARRWRRSALDAGTGAAGIRQRGAEARAPAENRARRNPLVPGLFRAGRRLRPRLACRPAARTAGDHWLINGQKIWTSYADKADWMLLPRAHRHREEARRHLLHADRHGHRPAWKTRPITLISGECPSAKPSSPT